MPEQHEFVQKMDSYEKAADGVVFHCTTSQGKSVDILLTVCTPHILRLRMCPDPELASIKGLLEIKEEWPATASDVAETPEAVSVDTGAVRFEARKDPWKYIIYDKAGEVVLEENVCDQDAAASYRSLAVGFTSQDGKFCRSNETFNLSPVSPGEAFYGFGEKFTRPASSGRRSRGGTSTLSARGPRMRTRTFPSS